MEKQLFIMGMIRVGTDGKLYDFQIPKEQVMDKADEQILKLLQGNARISFQKLGEAIGLSRVAVIAVSDDIHDLKYLTRMIRKRCGEDILELHCHAVKEVIKDVYGGIAYEKRTESDIGRTHE